MTLQLARLKTIRRATLILALVFATAPNANAQQITNQFGPGCGPGTSCSLMRFFIAANSAPLSIDHLVLHFLDPNYSFTTGIFSAQDDFGPFSGAALVQGGLGNTVDLDFINTGDPNNPGFPFTLALGSSGFVDVDLFFDPATTAMPYFEYTGTLSNGALFTGTVTPEPASLALLATGLAGLAGGGVVRRRRRRDDVHHAA